MSMSKAELREMLEQKMAEYDKPVYTWGESVDQQKRLQARCESRKKPPHLKQQDWDSQLQMAKEGRYESKPGEDIWLTEYAYGGKLKFEVEP